MAIVNNTLSDIGDVLFIYSQTVIDGDLILSGFTDDVSGETSTRYFEKQFKYSTDTVNYSSWMPLTNANITSIAATISKFHDEEEFFPVRYLLFLEFRYERKGTDNTGILEFNGIEIQGNAKFHFPNHTTTSDSIFSQLCCNDFYTIAIRNNLLKKIYYHGIVPRYIERGEGIDDADYIDFWSAICIFLSFVSSFSNNFDLIFFKRDLLTQYLHQQGLRYCEKEITLVDLQYLTSNFYDEIRKRGTALTYKKKYAKLLSGDFTQTDGEWLRVLCRNPYDEFLLDVIETAHHGHCVGNSSPLYNGHCYSNQINKTEENTADFINLSKYSLIGSPAIVTNGSKRCLSITGSSKSGLGYDVSNPPTIALIEELITVEPEIDYEISFDIKRISGSGEIEFGVLGFNRNGAYKPSSFNRIDNGIIHQFFLQESVNKVCKITNEWYSIRGIIYAKDSMNISTDDAKLNINRGVNLKFNTFEDIEKLKIFLTIEKSNVLIHNLKMRPLIKGKNILKRITTPRFKGLNNYPTGIGFISQALEPYIKNPQFIQNPTMVLNWRKNNNESMDDLELDNFIQEYLLPYQQKLISIPLTLKVDDKQI